MVNPLAHLSEAEVGALVFSSGQDEALEPGRLSHLATCAECETLVRVHRRADREAAALLLALDVSAPEKPVRSIITAARGRQIPRNFGRKRAAAAALFLAVATAAAAAAAIPSSPLHRLLTRVFQRSTESSTAVAPPLTSPVPASPTVSFITTPGAPLEILFEGTGGTGAVDVRVNDTDQVSLSAAEREARYRIGTNSISIDQSPLGHFRLEIPRSLGRLNVYVGSDAVFTGGLSMANSPEAFTIQLIRSRANTSR